MDVYLINKKVVGTKVGKVYKKSVRKSKHLFRNIGMYGGWAINKDIIDNLVEDGTETILITEKEENKKYKISLDEFIKQAETINFGYGIQLVCSIDLFSSEAV